MERYLIFAAPSGAGKTTLIHYLMKHIPQLGFSVSATTRAPRHGETHGKDYYFVSKETFQQWIKENKLLEWQEVYKGYFYGTLKSEIERLQKMGKIPCFDVDVVGALRLKHYFQQRALACFIQPPSIAALKQRLLKRGTETEESLQQRLKRAQWELQWAPYFDAIIVNDDLQKAQQTLLHIVQAFLKGALQPKLLNLSLESLKQ